MAAVTQAMSLYRDVCRKELIAEQAYDAGALVEDDLHKAKIDVKVATLSMIDLFTALQPKGHGG